MIKCYRCDAEENESNSYCRNCGTKLVDFDGATELLSTTKLPDTTPIEATIDLNRKEAPEVIGIYATLPIDLLKEEFAKAKEKIRILKTWTAIVTTLCDPLITAASNDCAIEVLLLDPKSKFCTYRSRDLGKPDGYAKSLIEADIRAFKTVICDARDKAGSIEVKLYDATPTISVFAYDDVILFGQMWRRKYAISTPYFKAKADSLFGELVNNHFTDLWEKAILLNTD